MNILTLKIWQVNSYLKFRSVWDAMILQSKGRKIPFLVFAKWENHTTFVIYQFYNLSWPLKIKWKLLQILNWNICLDFKCRICTLPTSFFVYIFLFPVVPATNLGNPKSWVWLLSSSPPSPHLNKTGSDNLLGRWLGSRGRGTLAGLQMLSFTFRTVVLILCGKQRILSLGECT